VYVHYRVCYGGNTEALRRKNGGRTDKKESGHLCQLSCVLDSYNVVFLKAIPESKRLLIQNASLITLGDPSPLSLGLSLFMPQGEGTHDDDAANNCFKKEEVVVCEKKYDVAHCCYNVT